jgi:hypothetical protein
VFVAVSNGMNITIETKYPAFVNVATLKTINKKRVPYFVRGMRCIESVPHLVRWRNAYGKMKVVKQMRNRGV